jgi:hypothetical protein
MLTQKLKEFSEREADYRFLISTWWLITMFETTRRGSGLADFVRCVIKSHYSFQYGRMSMLQRLGVAMFAALWRHLT